MLALRADIQIIYKILSVKDPQLLKHFAEVSVDVSLITVESFLTLYTTTCHADMVDVIVDHLFVNSSTVLIKAMVVLLGYMREDLLAAENIGRQPSSRRPPGHVQGQTQKPYGGPPAVSQRPGNIPHVQVSDQRTARVLYRDGARLFLQQSVRSRQTSDDLQEELADLLPRSRTIQRQT